MYLERRHLASKAIVCSMDLGVEGGRHRDRDSWCLADPNEGAIVPVKLSGQSLTVLWEEAGSGKHYIKDGEKVTRTRCPIRRGPCQYYVMAGEQRLMSHQAHYLCKGDTLIIRFFLSRDELEARRA